MTSTTRVMSETETATPRPWRCPVRLRSALARVSALLALKTIRFTGRDFERFVNQFPNYAIWKTVATELRVPVTCIIGQLDKDYIGTRVYADMSADIGPEAFRAAVNSPDVDFHCAHLDRLGRHQRRCATACARRSKPQIEHVLASVTTSSRRGRAHAMHGWSVSAAHRAG